jgi:pimeloyl-ACP methyl ester carboxylesterase
MTTSIINPNKADPLVIMIHGSWHWGGCFQHLANSIALKGHRVACPDLKSHGYDNTPVEQLRSMAEYVEPVERILLRSGTPVVLVGHSMGGVTASYLAQRFPEKVGLAVYIAGFMTPAGRSANDYLASFSADPDMADFGAMLSHVPGGRALNLSLTAALRSVFYHDCSDADFSVALKNLCPTTTFLPDAHACESTRDRFGRVGRLYIECTDDRAIPIRVQRQMIADVPGAKVVSMGTSHSPFFSRPEALADIIVENLREIPTLPPSE